MESLSLQLCLLLLLSLWAPVPASSLEGSCVSAGFTECCDLEVDGACFAPPTYCLCDPSCREHDDCCSDIDEICTPDHPRPVLPSILLAVDLAFHTATLLWTLPPPSEAKDTANPNYTVVYWDHSDPNTTISHTVSQDLVGSGQQSVWVTLTNLAPGVLYQWTVEATIHTVTTASVVSNFSTTAVVSLERLSVGVLNTSAVLVSWTHPQLPMRVQLYNYLVSYSEIRTSYTSSDRELHSGSVDVWENSVALAGLVSGVSYSVSVQSVVLEDGVQSDDAVLSENVTVYVPDSTTVQLRGGPFKPCDTWTVETEREALERFRSSIRQAICSEGDHKSDDYRGRDLIEKDFVICEEGASSRAVYRASVYTSPLVTTDTITSILQERVYSGSVSGLEVDPTCPVRLHTASQPLCRPLTPQRDCETATTALADPLSFEEEGGQQSVVTVPLLVSALVAELFLFIFVSLSVTAVVLLVRRRRYLKEEKAAQVSTHNPTQPNEYS